MVRTKQSVTNSHVEYYRRFSYILSPSQRGNLNPLIDENSKDDLRRELYQIEGHPAHPGLVLNSAFHVWEPARIGTLKEQLEELEQGFQWLQKQNLNQGNRPLTKMPADLQKKKEKIQAKIQVAHEEADWLKEKLEKVLQVKPETGLEPIQHRMYWGSGQLKNGILDSLGGIHCEMGPDDILIISDERSPYDKMEVWRFKSEITRAMALEFKHRSRMESKLAESEKRPPQSVDYPELPIINKNTGAIEYPDYDNSTIKKLKNES